MYQCNKCNKEFKYESELKRHKNKKILCNKQKSEYNCNLCNIKFKYESDYLRHEKTKKHIYNLSNNNYEETYNNNTLINENNDLINNNMELTNTNNELINENIKLKNKINILEKCVKQLELENLKFKSKNKLHNQLEYIYIIHPIQCLNMNIYKIGRTSNIINRHKQYPKGSELLFTMPCYNSKVIEQEILNYLKQNVAYNQAKEYGIEYFQCDLNMLINDIQNLINKN